MNRDELRVLRKDAAILICTICLVIYCVASEPASGPMWFSLLLSLSISIKIFVRLMKGEAERTAL